MQTPVLQAAHLDGALPGDSMGPCQEIKCCGGRNNEESFCEGWTTFRPRRRPGHVTDSGQWTANKARLRPGWVLKADAMGTTIEDQTKAFCFSSIDADGMMLHHIMPFQRRTHQCVARNPKSHA
jgi:hypothetical protein